MPAKPYIPYDGPVVTRAEAKTAGLKRYFTGEPCRNGHVSERTTVNHSCLRCKSICQKDIYQSDLEKYRAISRIFAKCHKERLAEERKNMSLEKKANINERRKITKTKKPEKYKRIYKEWRLKNIERMRAYTRDWRSKNIEKVRAGQRQARLKNIEKARTQGRMAYARNPEKSKARAKAWRELFPEKRACNHRSRKARQRNAVGSHTTEDIQRIGNAQKWKCGWCRISCKTRYHVDHIVALSKGGSNWPKNLLIACPNCNMHKNASDPITFAQRLGMLL